MAFNLQWTHDQVSVLLRSHYILRLSKLEVFGLIKYACFQPLSLVFSEEVRLVVVISISTLSSHQYWRSYQHSLGWFVLHDVDCVAYPFINCMPSKPSRTVSAEVHTVLWLSSRPFVPTFLIVSIFIKRIQLSCFCSQYGMFRGVTLPSTGCKALGESSLNCFNCSYSGLNNQHFHGCFLLFSS